MRKFLTILFMTLLAYAAGYDVGWAADETITITLDDVTFSSGSGYRSATATVNGFVFQLPKATSNNGNIQLNTNTNGKPGQLYNSTAITGLKSIKVNLSSGKYKIATGTSSNPTSNYSTEYSATNTVNANSGDSYFTIQVNGATYITSIVVTYESAPAVTAPTIKINGNTFTDGSKFEKNAKLTIESEGNTLYYTQGTSSAPDDPTTSLTPYSDPITITYNTYGTYYIKAIASDGSNTSTVTSKYFIVATKYAISTTTPDNGSLTTDVATAFADDEVTVTATPSTGYTLSAITVTGNTSGNNVTVANGKFTMPAEAVTVSASFKKSTSATATFDATTDVGDGSITKNPVTFTCSSGVLNNKSEYRLYKNSTSTFSVPTGSGYKIIKIEFTGTSSNPVSGFEQTTGLTTDTDGYDGTWNGEAESVSFTASGSQVRCTQITVTYSVPATGKYKITVNQPTGGEISADKTTADEGVTVTLSVDSTTAGYQFSAWNVYKTGDATTTVTVDVTNNTFTMPAYDVTVTASFTKKQQANGYFEKVTSTADITDGQYLIVYGDGNVAFNGGLETLDAVSNTIDVTIVDNKIVATDEALEAVFTIDTSAGTILSASGKYIGTTGNSNGLLSSDDPLTNTLTYNSGDVDIKSSGGAYLRYNSASNQLRFRYYKSSSYSDQKAIQLYKLVFPLAELLTKGHKGGTYAIADGDLLAVALSADRKTLFCKDDNRYADPQSADGKVDYMVEYGFNTPQVYDQSNWVALTSENKELDEKLVGHYLRGVSGTLSDLANPSLALAAAPARAVDKSGSAYLKGKPNQFIPTSFMGKSVVVSGGKAFFFVTPKPMEVAIVTWACWDGENNMFVSVPNPYDLQGEFEVDTKYLENFEIWPNELQNDSVYEFTAVITHEGGASPAPGRLKSETSASDYGIYPLSAPTRIGYVSGGTVTGITGVNGGVKEVKSVRVYNVAGVEQRELQPGVNIVVTTYTDGTRSTAKVLR